MSDTPETGIRQNPTIRQIFMAAPLLCLMQFEIPTHIEKFQLHKFNRVYIEWLHKLNGLYIDNINSMAAKTLAT